MDHSTVSNADHSQHGGASTRSRAEHPKPQWRGGAHRKCWVCHNIRCTCEHSTLHATNGSRGSSAVDTSVTSRRGRHDESIVDRSHLDASSYHVASRRHGGSSNASARSVSPKAKTKRRPAAATGARGAPHDSASDVSNGFVRAHTHAVVANPSAVDRLHRGLSARPKEQFHGITPSNTAPSNRKPSTASRLAPPPSSSNRTRGAAAAAAQESPRPKQARSTSRAQHADPQTVNALTSPQTVIGTRRVVRHRLWHDEHGHAHSSEIDDEEIVSTATSALTNNTAPVVAAVAATATTPRGSSVPPTVGRMRLHNRTHSGGGSPPVVVVAAATTPDFTLPDVSTPSQPRPRPSQPRQQHQGDRSQSTGRSRPHEDVGGDDVGVSPSRLVQMAEQGSSNDSPPPPPPRIAIVEPSVSPVPAAATHDGAHRSQQPEVTVDTSANLPSPIPKEGPPAASDDAHRHTKHHKHHRHRHHHRRHHHRHHQEGEGSYTSSSSQTTTVSATTTADDDDDDGSEFTLSDRDGDGRRQKRKHHHRHRHRHHDHHHHRDADDAKDTAKPRSKPADAKGRSDAPPRRTASAPSRPPQRTGSSHGKERRVPAATPQPEAKKREPAAAAASSSSTTAEADELRRQVALLTSRQQELQSHVATAESQLAALVAERKEQQQQQQHESHESHTAASSDIDELPVHPAFRAPSSNKKSAAASPPPPETKRYKGGVPMGGGVGHIKPPNDHYRGSGNSRRGRAEAPGYGGYLVRGLVHVATMPFTCCMRPQASDDDDDDGDGVADGPGDVAAVAERSGHGPDADAAAGDEPAVDPRLLAEAFAAAQAREAAAAASAAAEATAQAEADLRAMEASLANIASNGRGGSMSSSAPLDALSSPAGSAPGKNGDASAPTRTHTV